MHKKVIFAAFLSLTSSDTSLPIEIKHLPIVEVPVQLKVNDILEPVPDKKEEAVLNNTDFYNKVIKPIRYVIGNDNFNTIELDEELLVLLGIVEHMGDPTVDDLNNIVGKFSEDSYKELQIAKSEKGAIGIWQIMPRVGESLNDMYRIKSLISIHKPAIVKDFGLHTEEDFRILRNGLYAAYLIHSIKLALTNNGIDANYENIAGVYNMGPRFMNAKETKLNPETRKYIKKARMVEPLMPGILVSSANIN